jgi:hypothetical protein
MNYFFIFNLYYQITLKTIISPLNEENVFLNILMRK